MKNVLAAVFFMATIIMTGQEKRPERGRMFANVTPQEMAQLQTKRLTLALVLNDQQQKQLYDLNLTAAEKMKAKMVERQAAKSSEKADKTAHIDHKIDMLDTQIAYQQKMKSILNEKQFEQWRKMKGAKHKKKMHKMRERRNHKN
ncbi:DUF4890 domain-containing protein [Leeuwenhoekiella sp. A16]|uniref:DUF4890 domain-containing protein n=1 Tax=unclassified Leeuwenhoekiella TaxID=2615029 RepID=UPI003A7F9FB0|tara:strand:+ start:16572 stop:17006 length:435 start_codon:yes stop_codon:yes gene_type:complete